jgi:hypothetical protein
MALLPLINLLGNIGEAVCEGIEFFLRFLGNLSAASSLACRRASTRGYPRTILQIAQPAVRAGTFLRGGLKMPFFECKVSRTVFTDDLKAKRATETVYIEAKDEREAKQKAEHPKNWLRSAATFGTVDKSSSFLITVGECRRVADDKLKALTPVDPATRFHQSPFWGEHDNSR